MTNYEEQDYYEYDDREEFEDNDSPAWRNGDDPASRREMWNDMNDGHLMDFPDEFDKNDGFMGE